MVTTSTRRTLPALGGAALLAAVYDIPQDVLVALSQTVTRVNHHDGEPSASAGYGLMHLYQNPETDTLATAAELTGSSESELKSDEAANIAGAAIMRAHAAALELDAAERVDADMWYEPLACYSGLDDPTIARLEADAVYDYLETTFSTRSGASGSASSRAASTPSSVPSRTCRRWTTNWTPSPRTTHPL